MDGRFSHEVQLNPGHNLVEILASTSEGEPKNVGSNQEAGEGTEGEPKNVGSDDDAGEGTPSSGGQGTSGSSSSN